MLAWNYCTMSIARRKTQKENHFCPEARNYDKKNNFIKINREKKRKIFSIS